MGGGSQQTTSTNFSPEQRRLQDLQANIATSFAPGIQQYVLGVLGGDPMRATGFGTSMAAPVEAATKRALSGILQRVPRGGMQQQLLEETRMQGALERGKVEQDYIQRALEMASRIFGYQGPPQGQTTTQSGGPRFGISLPFFSTTF